MKEKCQKCYKEYGRSWTTLVEKDWKRGLVFCPEGGVNYGMESLAVPCDNGASKGVDIESKPVDLRAV